VEALKKQQESISEEIQTLQDEIKTLDPDAFENNARLVIIDTLGNMDFAHYIELQGFVDADNISIVTPRGNPGQVKQVLVKKGDRVKKGQLLLRLDDAIIQQNIRASKDGILSFKTQLSLANELLTRQQNLWSKGIGTEVQLLTAKNNVEALNNQIQSAQEQVKVLEEQQKTSNVYAEVSGIADEVNIKVGEFFQGAIGSTPQIRIVNTSSLKVKINIPENYVDRVNKGTKVLVTIPDIDKTYTTNLSYLSAIIDPSSRSFETEAKLPSDGILKPNMIATVKILDYASPNTMVIPVNVVQSDEKGKYVFVYSEENGKKYARKKPVGVGQMQGGMIEILTGLSKGQQLVVKGYQGLYDGQEITTSTTL
jgi:RND family efflux transporter MFP subunit